MAKVQVNVNKYGWVRENSIEEEKRKDYFTF